MDRFEGTKKSSINIDIIDLHSSMDRFEGGVSELSSKLITKFTFQYG